jgi:DNA-binding GntR family transcriptional regulator
MAGRTIARDSPIPYHHQLHEILADALDRNVWKVGEMIPSEADLATTYGISRTVIRKALDRLVAVGRVQRLKGKGTVVVDPPRFSLDVAAAAARWAERFESLRLGRVLDSRKVPGGPAGSPLRLEAADQAFQVTCLRTNGNRPVALTQLFLRQDASPAVKRVAQSGGVIELDVNGSTIARQLKSRYGVRTSRYEAFIEPTICGETEARALEIQPHQAVLSLTVVSCDRDGKPTWFTRNLLCTEWSRIASS